MGSSEIDETSVAGAILGMLDSFIERAQSDRAQFVAMLDNEGSTPDEVTNALIDIAAGLLAVADISKHNAAQIIGWLKTKHAERRQHIAGLN